MKCAWFLAVTLSLGLLGCSSQPEAEHNASEIGTEELNAEIQDPGDEPEEEAEAIWALYEGKLGLYEPQIVMELVITGEKVSGSYFYAKHQKTIELVGTIDPGTQMVHLTEMYKGKATGYFEFRAGKGELNGHWMKTAGSAEKEDFTARLVPLSEKEYAPSHTSYAQVHEVTFYGEEEEMVDKVTDVLKISQLGKGYYVFYLSVMGQNGHTGAVEGLAKTSGGEIYFEGEEGCRLAFKLDKKTASVSEAQDCSYYRGFRAYFDGVFTKKN